MERRRIKDGEAGKLLKERDDELAGPGRIIAEQQHAGCTPRAVESAIRTALKSCARAISHLLR